MHKERPLKVVIGEALELASRLGLACGADSPVELLAELDERPEDELDELAVVRAGKALYVAAHAVRAVLARVARYAPSIEDRLDVSTRLEEFIVDAEHAVAAALLLNTAAKRAPLLSVVGGRGVPRPRELARERSR